MIVLAPWARTLGANGATRDLHAASGWGGSSYTSARDAAPFAILDTVYDAMQFVRPEVETVCVGQATWTAAVLGLAIARSSKTTA